MDGRTRRTAIAVITGAAAIISVLAAPAAPAGAAEPETPYFVEDSSAEVQAPTDAQAAVGHFTDAVFDDILWYIPGPGKESIWTPCPDCESGPFTKKQLPAALQVSGYYEPIVGDFAGSGLDDIYWLNQQGADYLWTSIGSGSFTSKRFDGPAGEWSVLVLPDSRSGEGKDDLLWSTYQGQPGRLWVFPDSGSGVARTKARPVLPEGEPLVGDFDGNGAADILFYPHVTPCRCPVPSAASRTDTLWRRSSSEAPGFTASTMNIKGEYNPVVGRFSAEGDQRDDILWIGQYWICCGSPEERPDSLWEGRASGTFAASSQSFPSAGGGFVLGHDGADTAVVFGGSAGGGESQVWVDTESGPQLRPVGTQLPGYLDELLITGRFTTADREDYYLPGFSGEPDTLYHPTT